MSYLIGNFILKKEEHFWWPPVYILYIINIKYMTLIIDSQNNYCSILPFD